MSDRTSGRTPAPGAGSSPLAALTSLGQRLAGASSSDTVAALLAATLQELLAPRSMLVVFHDGDRRRVAHAHNIANPRPDDPEVDDAIRGLRVRGGWLGAPIRGAGGRTIGAVTLTAPAGREYGEADLEIAHAAVTQVSIALENSRLLELLSDGKREWEQTVDAVSEAFCILDETGNVLRANRAFAEFAKHPLTALAGRHWMSLLPEPWAAPIARALATPELTGVELVADGRL